MSVVDADTLACQYVNSRIHDFLGWEPDEVAAWGTSFLERIVARDDLDHVIELVRTVAGGDTDEIVRRRCHLQTKDGAEAAFRLGLVPLSRREREHADEVLFVAVPLIED
jgi:PAS domain S-box-containing protein